MRTIILISICLLWGISTWGQKPTQKPKKQDSFSTMLEEGNRLFNSKEKDNITKSIKAYNVARILAGSDKYRNDIIDKKIDEVFHAIEKQKQDAIKSEKKAKIAAGDATALYWTSVAGKIKPVQGQGLALLKKATSKTKDPTILNLIKEATESIFNQSNTHKFIKSEFLSSLSDKSIETQQDRRKIVNEREYTFLPKGKGDTIVNISSDKRWLLTKNKNEGEYKLWEIAKAKENNFLLGESNIIDATFSPDSKWLLTRTENETKLWDISKDSVIAHNFLLPEKGINTFQFSPDSKWLLTRNTQFKIKIWEMAKEKNFIPISWEDDISDAQFSSDSKWLKTKKNDKYQLCSLSGLDESVFLQKNGDKRYYTTYGKLLLTETKDLKSNILEIAQENVLYDSLSKVQNLYRAILSNDRTLLFALYDNNECILAQTVTGKIYNFLSNEQNIIDADFSPDSKFLLTITNEDGKLWEIDKGIAHNFLSKEKGISYNKFSPDSKWLITRNGGYVYKIWQIPNGDNLKFLAGEQGNIINADFSSGSKYLNDNNGTKIVELITDKVYQKSLNEKNTNNGSAIANSTQSNTKENENGKKKKSQFSLGKSSIFTKDSTILCTTTNHQVKTYKVSTGEPIQTLWLNKKPKEVQIIDNRYLYVTVGKAIVKTDLQTQKGNLMSFGDGEPLDYKYDEIQEWIKVFGDKYLLPLDEEIKKKYGIK